jgi:hypothetical protein
VAILGEGSIEKRKLNQRFRFQVKKPQNTDYILSTNIGTSEGLSSNQLKKSNRSFGEEGIEYAGVKRTFSSNPSASLGKHDFHLKKNSFARSSPRNSKFA